MIERTSYLTALQRSIGTPLVKVLTGIRRCGKSTILSLFQDQLRAQGQEERRILKVNMESLEFDHLRDYRIMYAFVKERLPDGGFPTLHLLGDDDASPTSYLNTLLDGILMHDVVQRHAIRDPEGLRRILTFAFDNIGSPPPGASASTSNPSGAASPQHCRELPCLDLRCLRPVPGSPLRHQRQTAAGIRGEILRRRPLLDARQHTSVFRLDV